MNIGQERFFVKTAGCAKDGDHDFRISRLRNAVSLAESCQHPSLPRLRRVIESPSGPMLFYEWADGYLVRNALTRVRTLPPSEISGILSVLYDLHTQLAERGWIACDFYDGSMIYDFVRRRLRVVDLDHYRQSARQGMFVNTIGRMYGSRRFMAPEESERGALIDERTTVFTMGRAAAALLSDASLERCRFSGSEAEYETMLRACKDDPRERFQTMRNLFDAWTQAQLLRDTLSS